MTICTEQRPEYFQFFNTASGTNHQPSLTRVLASIDGDKVRAVVLYSRFARGACEMSIVSNGMKCWATKEFLQIGFGIPFNHYNVNRCGVIINVANEPSWKLALQLGFQLEGVLRKYFDGADAYAMGMIRSDCKWIKEL